MYCVCKGRRLKGGIDLNFFCAVKTPMIDDLAGTLLCGPLCLSFIGISQWRRFRSLNIGGRGGIIRSPLSSAYDESEKIDVRQSPSICRCFKLDFCHPWRLPELLGFRRSGLFELLYPYTQTEALSVSLFVWLKSNLKPLSAANNPIIRFNIMLDGIKLEIEMAPIKGPALVYIWYGYS